MSFTQQGPLAQKINAKFHTEPLATIAYGAYWIGLFIIAPVVVIPFLILSTIRELILQYLGKSNVTPVYDPKNQPQHDLAVVITGCDTGFGKDLAIYAANAGYTVFAGCLFVEKSSKQFETFPKVRTFQCDVTSDSEVTAGAKVVNDWVHDTDIPVQDVGRKRVLFAIVNNAGIGRPGETDTSTLQDFQEIMDVNFFGQVRIVKAFLPLLKEQAIQRSLGSAGTMRIINVTSAAGLIDGSNGIITYHCSKHAAQSFTNNLRIELRPFHIAVSSVNPTFHLTPIIDNAEERSKQHGEKIPQDIRDQYGVEYFKGLKGATKYYSVWNSAVVVEEILYKGIMAEHPARELLIGLDCKFLVGSLMRMLPSFIKEPLIHLGRPTPACMLQTPSPPPKQT